MDYCWRVLICWEVPFHVYWQVCHGWKFDWSSWNQYLFFIQKFLKQKMMLYLIVYLSGYAINPFGSWASSISCSQGRFTLSNVMNGLFLNLYIYHYYFIMYFILTKKCCLTHSLILDGWDSSLAPITTMLFNLTDPEKLLFK